MSLIIFRLHSRSFQITRYAEEKEKLGEHRTQDFDLKKVVHVPTERRPDSLHLGI